MFRFQVWHFTVKAVRLQRTLLEYTHRYNVHFFRILPTFTFHIISTLLFSLKTLLNYKHVPLYITKTLLFCHNKPLHRRSQQITFAYFRKMAKKHNSAS